MESHFDISIERAGGNINLRLLGDFDDASANLLIECLKENGKNVGIAVIETSDLHHIDPSASDIFQRRVHGLKDLCYRLVFCGKHASQLIPAWVNYF